MNVQRSAICPSELTWVKSSHSGTSGGDCVEMAATPFIVHVRDSKDRHGPVLSFRPEAWSAFVAYAKTTVELAPELS